MKEIRLLDGKWVLCNGSIYDPFDRRYIEGDLLLEDGVITKIGKISKNSNIKKLTVLVKL